MQYKSGVDRNLDNPQAIYRPCWLQAKLPDSLPEIRSLVGPLFKGVCMRTAFHNNGPFKLVPAHSI